MFNFDYLNKNACFLSYGQSGSGKSYSLFGNVQNPGIVPLFVQTMLEKSQAVEVSFQEIYIDQIKDLNTNLVTEDFTRRQIMLINDLWDMIRIVRKTDIKRQVRTHVIITLYLNQNTKIQFVDLAGSERVAKNITEGEKYQEAIMILFRVQSTSDFLIKSLVLGILILKLIVQIYYILKHYKFNFYNHIIYTQFNQLFYNIINLYLTLLIQKLDDLTIIWKYQISFNQTITSSHQVLNKCLNLFNQNKVIPKRESKLTQALIIENNTQVILIGTINPSQSNYEECLLTLQYLDRTKNIQVQIRKQQSLLGLDTPNNSQQDKVIKRLQEEIQEYKQKIEQLNLDRKKKFLDLQKLLGLDIDLERLSAKNAKDITIFRNQQEALQKNASLKEQLEQQQYEIAELLKKNEELKQDFHHKLERYQSQLLEQREINKKFKDQINMTKMSGDDALRQLNSERDHFIKKLQDESKNLLEDKVTSIINLPQTALTKLSENQKLQDIRRQVRNEAEKEFYKQLEQAKLENQKWLETCKQQYEYHLNEKNKEIENFLSSFKQYREKKKQQINEITDELLDLYDIIQKQNKVIDKIETGGYSGGLKSFSIPKQDKPNLPNKVKHKNLFFYLDTKSISATITKKASTIEKTIKTATKQLKQSQTQIAIEIDYNQIDQINFLSMDLSTLRSYANKLREIIKELQDQMVMVQDKCKQQIAQMQREREEAIQKYNNENRRYNQNRVVIESQNRMLQKIRPISSIQRKL